MIIHKHDWEHFQSTCCRKMYRCKICPKIWMHRDPPDSFLGQMENIIGDERGFLNIQTLSGAGGCSPMTCTGYLICQGLETPGWDNSESWTETPGTGGIITDDSTDQILAGCASLKIYSGDAAQNSIVTSPTYTGTEYQYAVFRFRTDELPAAARAIFLWRAGTTTIIGGQVTDTGQLKVFRGAFNATTTDSISVDTNYYIWMRYRGSTPYTVSIGFSTTNTEPTSGTKFASVDADSTSFPDNIQLSARQDTITHWFDNIIVDNNPITPP